MMLMLYARQHRDLSDFDDALVDMVFGYTKLYSHREKADTSFEITNEQIRLFSSLLLLSGVISFQTVKCTGRRPMIHTFV